MAARKAKRQSRFHGVVVVDKPGGMTSQDVVDVVRKLSHTRRVGHTGTLDPMATGLLVLLLGEGTKLSEYLMGFDKTYEGTMRLGVESDTYDATGTLVEHPAAPLPGVDRLRELARPLTGDIMQTPPPYSAVKVAGRKLYEYAREGQPVEVDARPARIDEFHIDGVEGPVARFRIACGSGTYVRSLVHELGQAAGCGAVVESLRRTSVGDIQLAEATPLATMRDLGPDGFAQFVLPMVDALTSWPIYLVTSEGLEWLKRGQAIPTSLARLEQESQPAGMGEAAFLAVEGADAVAVVKVVPAPPSRPPAVLRGHTGMWFQPIKLLGIGE